MSVWVWALAGGCAEPDPVALAPGEAEALIDPAAWTPVAPAADPLAAHRPPGDGDVDPCPPSTWGLEGPVLEVQTGACTYLALAQPALVALAEGDTLETTVWHADLDAAEPATGHVALLVGDAVVWEAVVEIPTEADVLAVSVPVEAAWAGPAGTPIGLHLHNHGFNAWSADAVWRVR
jgi:hypothetical protein